MNTFDKIPYSEKYNSVKNTFKFCQCRLADSVELLKQEMWKETLGKCGLRREKKPRCYYRRWCINEWFFKW